LPAAILNPREQLVGREAEGDGREKIERRCLLFPIVLARVIHVGDAGRDRIERFERAHKRSSGKNLDLDAAVGGNADHLRETQRTGVKARCVLGPLGHHFQSSDSLSNRGRREAHTRAGNR
jgi:hypothetical protein